MEMKQLYFVSACVMVLAFVKSVGGGTNTLELFRMADLRLPENPVSIIPDIKEGKNGVWEEAFVFSAQNPTGNRFDVHCRRMNAKDIFRRHQGLEDYVGDLIVTGCVRAIISQTPCYSKGLILDSAMEVDECGHFSRCKMYLLKRDRNRFKSVSFAEQANANGLLLYAVEESLFHYRTSESNDLSRVWVLKKEIKGKGLPPKWSIVEAKIDLNLMSNVSERVLMSYEDFQSPGLSM